MELQEIINNLKELELGEEDEPCFQAAVVIMYGIIHNTTSSAKIKKGTGYLYQDVVHVMNRLRKGGLIIQEQWNSDEILSEERPEISLTLAALVGIGEIACITYIDGKPIEQ